MFFKYLYNIIIKNIEYRDIGYIGSILSSILVLTLVQTFIISLSDDIISGFYTAIIEENVNKFVKIIIESVSVMLISALLGGVLEFIVNILSYFIRKIVCSYIQVKYLAYHRKNTTTTTNPHDNPDQRIAQDILEWSNDLSIICEQMINTPCIIIYYTIMTIRNIGWYAPLIIYIWVSLGFIINYPLMVVIRNKSYLQSVYEGHFRFFHMFVRSHIPILKIIANNNINDMHYDHNVDDNKYTKYEKIDKEKNENGKSDGEDEHMKIYEKDEKEYIHMPLITDTPISINNTSNVELDGLTLAFKQVCKNKLIMVKWEWVLNTIINIFTYMISIINYIVVAIPILFIDKDIDTSITTYMTSAVFSMIMLSYGFTSVLKLCTLYAHFIAKTDRIGELISTYDNINPNKNEQAMISDQVMISEDIVISEDVVISGKVVANGGVDHQNLDTNLMDNNICIKDLSHHTPCHKTPIQQFDSSGDQTGTSGLMVNSICIKNLSYHTPCGKTLIQHMNLDVQIGDRLLVTGFGAIGKSIFVKILASSWPHMSYSILHIPSNIYIIPQQFYIPLVSIDKQITYPSNVMMTYEEIDELLISVGLSSLLTRDHIWSAYSGNDNYWTFSLSPSEKQCLMFARMLFHLRCCEQPRIVLLDDVTSYCSQELEYKLYNALMAINNIAIISIGNRKSLQRYHKKILRMNIDCTTDEYYIDAEKQFYDQYDEINLSNDINIDDDDI